MTFAVQESFWRDFLDGKIDERAFREYYDTTDNGYFDFTGAKERGGSFRSLLEHPYARYYNNQDFVGKVYSEEELP